MYDENGKWHCERFEDCFECPYSDCLRGTKRIPKIDIRPDKYRRPSEGLNTAKNKKKTKYEKLKNLGICPRCRGKASIGKVYCRVCQIKHNAYLRKYRQKKGAYEIWGASRKRFRSTRSS